MLILCSGPSQRPTKGSGSLPKRLLHNVAKDFKKGDLEHITTVHIDILYHLLLSFIMYVCMYVQYITDLSYSVVP